MIVAEFSVVPIGEGTSVGCFVRAAVKAVSINHPHVRMEHSAMGTVLEAESLEEIWSAVKTAHEKMFAEGARRVITTLKIDDRRDKETTTESKRRVFSQE